MDRRAFITVVSGSILAAPLAVEGQPTGKVPRIGLLSAFSPSDTALWHQAFRLGLHDLGWVEGKNISIEYRYAEGRHDRLPDLAAELVRLRVDIIVATAGSDARAAKNATGAIPIVVASAASELVESLARPGGNITGLSQMAPDLAGKRLELLKEIVPKLSRVAVLWNPEGRGSMVTWQEIQLPVRQLGLQLHSLEVRSTDDFEMAFRDATRSGAGALVILPDPVFVTNLKRLADLAAKSRLPSIFHLREFVNSGGLVAYGADRSDLFRRAAKYVDKILKGSKPGEIPIEQATKFELIINLKTAKALGLTIPQSLLLRADQVIE